METIRTFKLLTGLAVAMALIACPAADAAGRGAAKAAGAGKGATGRGPGVPGAATAGAAARGAAGQALVINMGESKEDAAAAAAVEAVQAWQAPQALMLAMPEGDAQARLKAIKALVEDSSSSSPISKGYLLSTTAKVAAVYGIHAVSELEKFRTPVLCLGLLHKTINTKLKNQTTENIKQLIAELPLDNVGYPAYDDYGRPVTRAAEGRGRVQICTPVKEMFATMVDAKEYIKLVGMITGCKKTKKEHMEKNHIAARDIQAMENACELVVKAITEAETINGTMTNYGKNVLVGIGAVQAIALSALASKAETGSVTAGLKGFGGIAKVGALAAVGAAANIAYHNKWLPGGSDISKWFALPSMPSLNVGQGVEAAAKLAIGGLKFLARVI